MKDRKKEDREFGDIGKFVVRNQMRGKEWEQGKFPNFSSSLNLISLESVPFFRISP